MWLYFGVLCTSGTRRRTGNEFHWLLPSLAGDIPATIFWGGVGFFTISRFGSKLRFFLCDCLHATIYGSGFREWLFGFVSSQPNYFSPVFHTMVSLFNAEPVRALIDTEVGVSTIALSLARRWWPEVRLGECMQGVLATQFEGVFYSVHCDFIVVLQNEQLAGWPLIIIHVLYVVSEVQCLLQIYIMRGKRICTFLRLYVNNIDEGADDPTKRTHIGVTTS
jgi:hypothetical protein